MRKLIDGQNVDGATGDYPKGRSRDKDGATPGTITNELIRGDAEQFFQKLIIDAGIVENDLPDNVSNGYQLVESLIAKIKETVGNIKHIGIDIGDWDMQADSSRIINLNYLNIDFAKITSIHVFIISDPGVTIGGTELHELNDGGNFSFNWNGGVGDGDLQMFRDGGGFFDSTAFNSTAYNRGHITVSYKLD
jgi:hypothetical protein